MQRGGKKTKTPAKDGFEHDMVTGWRKKGLIVHKAGVWKSIKKRMNKRERREGKQLEIENEQ